MPKGIQGFQKGHPKPKNAYKFTVGNKINKGKHNSPDTEFKKGTTSWCNGIIGWTKNYKNAGFQKGNKNPKWNGGITTLRNKIYKSYEWKIWRSKIFERDNWICQTCGKKSEGDIEPHHTPKGFAQILNENNIKTLEEAVFCKELWNIGNGITLCKKCHKLTKNYFNYNQKNVG